MKYTIRIIPKSSQTKIIEEKDDFLKIKLKAAPEKGKANAELIKFLAKHFKTAKSNINIIKGKTSKNKVIEIK
jgi:uncharacterized protein